MGIVAFALGTQSILTNTRYLLIKCTVVCYLIVYCIALLIKAIVCTVRMFSFRHIFLVIVRSEN